MNLVEKLMDDLMTADGIDPSSARASASRSVARYEQLAIQALTTIRFALEQEGETETVEAIERLQP